MSPISQTNNQKSTAKYRTLVVILGVLVALVIGFSVSATSLLPTETLHNHLIEASSSQKIWNSVTKGVSILHQFLLDLH